MPSFFFLDCCRLGHSSGNGVQTLIPVTLLTRLSCVRVSGFLCHTQDIREDKTHCHPQTLFARDKKKEGTSYKTKSRFFNTKRTWNLCTSSMSETMKFRFLFPCFLYLFEAKNMSLFTHTSISFQCFFALKQEILFHILIFSLWFLWQSSWVVSWDDVHECVSLFK